MQNATYVIRIVNNFSGDDDAFATVPLACGRIRAYIAAWLCHVATGKDVALLRHVGGALVTVTVF